MNNSPEIFFHVGLGKVASTYLQTKVFPQLKGIHYIPTGKYRKSKKIIQSHNGGKFLVSREFDRQLESEIKWFTRTFPETRIILLLRRHDSWIASQYRRHVKNGFFREFQEFIDIDEDRGYWKTRELRFYPMVQIIEKYTVHKPLVLFYEDLIRDPIGLVIKISQYTDTSFSKNKISLDRVHKSFSDKQLKFLRSFCRRYIRYFPKEYPNRLKHWLLFRPWWAFFHLILYISALFPESWISKDVLIKNSDLTMIKDYFEEDWRAVKEYVNSDDSLIEV